MEGLVNLSRRIDAATEWLGRRVAWLIVLAAVIGAGNAVVRKVFSVSSNAWLEIQWWLFAVAFLLAAPWTLKVNEHIRIDIVSSRWPKRVRDWIEVVGHVFFLIPSTVLIIITSASFFVTSYQQNEQAQNFGGLPQWPIKALIPVAFAVLLAQGLSELIKRVAIMQGRLEEPQQGPTHHPAVTELDIGSMSGSAEGPQTGRNPRRPE